MTLRKDAMEILRVFNNNVVLAKGGDGGEVSLTGRGQGFLALLVLLVVLWWGVVLGGGVLISRPIS